MLQKKDIETILKINGVSAVAPDEEIRTVLLSARYNNDEVDTAIMVLRENMKTHQTKVEGLHKIFRTDEALKPSEISALLGIDVQIDEITTPQDSSRENNFFQSSLVVIFATVFAVIGVVIAMYVYEVGIFHPVAAFG